MTLTGAAHCAPHALGQQRNRGLAALQQFLHASVDQILAFHASHGGLPWTFSASLRNCRVVSTNRRSQASRRSRCCLSRSSICADPERGSGVALPLSAAPVLGCSPAFTGACTSSIASESLSDGMQRTLSNPSSRRISSWNPKQCEPIDRKWMAEPAQIEHDVHADAQLVDVHRMEGSSSIGRECCVLVITG